VVAGVTLRISPEHSRSCVIRERLACPTERLRGGSEASAVHRFTSRTDEAAPVPLLGETPLVLRAHFGSSRVREDLPRLVREVGLSRAGCANHSPAPTDTCLVRRPRGMYCGRRKRDLGSPRAAVPSVRLHRTPRIAIDQSNFRLGNAIRVSANPSASLAHPTDGLRAGEPASVSPGWRIPRIRVAVTSAFRSRPDRGALPPRAAQPS